MDLNEFNRKRIERFILLYALYTILFCIFVLSINIDFILYYIITALIATFLAIFTIIFRIESKIDNFFFKFRKSLDKKICEFIQTIWEKNVKNINCENQCKYKEKDLCTYNFDIFTPRVHYICLNRTFFPILNSDKKFGPTKSFIYQENLNYYICIICLFLSVIYLLILNITILIKIYIGNLFGDFEYQINIFILQILFFTIFLIIQTIRNHIKTDDKNLGNLLRIITIIFFLAFIMISIKAVSIILVKNIGIYINYLMVFLIIIIILMIGALFGKNSRRIKNYIKINQQLQFDMILDLEFEEKGVSEKLRKSICEQTKKELFLMTDEFIIDAISEDWQDLQCLARRLEMTEDVNKKLLQYKLVDLESKDLIVLKVERGIKYWRINR